MQGIVPTTHELAIRRLPMNSVSSRLDLLRGRYDKLKGSDIHVMLALRCSSRQVVVADEQLDGPDMIGEFLGTRHPLTDHASQALGTFTAPIPP